MKATITRTIVEKHIDLKLTIECAGVERDLVTGWLNDACPQSQSHGKRIREVFCETASDEAIILAAAYEEWDNYREAAVKGAAEAIKANLEKWFRDNAPVVYALSQIYNGVCRIHGDHLKYAEVQGTRNANFSNRLVDVEQGRNWYNVDLLSRLRTVESGGSATAFANLENLVETLNRELDTLRDQFFGHGHPEALEVSPPCEMVAKTPACQH